MANNYYREVAHLTRILQEWRINDATGSMLEILIDTLVLKVGTIWTTQYRLTNKWLLS